MALPGEWKIVFWCAVVLSAFYPFGRRIVVNAQKEKQWNERVVKMARKEEHGRLYHILSRNDGRGDRLPHLSKIQHEQKQHGDRGNGLEIDADKETHSSYSFGEQPLAFTLSSSLSSDISALALYELAALQALYDTLGGVQWSWRADTATYGIPWNFTKGSLHDPCSELWQGISCSCAHNARPVPYYFYYDNVPDVPGTSYCSVTKIALGNFNLVGTLPRAAFGAFSQLSHLHMQYNYVQGDLSSLLCSLSSNMTKLNFYANDLTGTLPSSCIGRLTNLEILVLSYNALEGTRSALLRELLASKRVHLMPLPHALPLCNIIYLLAQLLDTTRHRFYS